MSEANKRQVGGSHYQTAEGSIQHWDLFGPDYLIGYATKYMRWRRKGGVKDLEKAIHVIEKLKEELAEDNWVEYDIQNVNSWCEAARLDWVECRVVKLIMFARGRSDLDEAIAGIRYLIARAEFEATCTVVTNTPRAGETEAQIAARERRVPRHDKGAVGLGFIQRTPEDGAHHASVHPWVVPQSWFSGHPEINADLISAFWTRRGDSYVLDPHVTCANIPRIVSTCYQLIPGGTWRLDMRRCPADARGYFPDLHREKNTKELEELPQWQQSLYEWDEQGNKYRLTERCAAWSRDNEEEAA